MKKNRFSPWAVSVLLAAAIGTPCAHAQPLEDAGVTGSASAATPAQNSKAIRKADRRLAKQVRHALVQVKGLDSERIVVSARSGSVTLGGSVPEAAQSGLAVAAAKAVSGVSNVTDSLTVKAPGQ